MIKIQELVFLLGIIALISFRCPALPLSKRIAQLFAYCEKGSPSSEIGVTAKSSFSVEKRCHPTFLQKLEISETDPGLWVLQLIAGTILRKPNPLLLVRRCDAFR